MVLKCCGEQPSLRLHVPVRIPTHEHTFQVRGLRKLRGELFVEVIKHPEGGREALGGTLREDGRMDRQTGGRKRNEGEAKGSEEGRKEEDGE